MTGANREKFQAVVILLLRKMGKISQRSISRLTMRKLNKQRLKLLGVTIDHQLSLSEHVKHISVKSRQKIGVLLRMKNLIPEKAKLHILKTKLIFYHI